MPERDREFYAELVGSHAAELYRYAYRRSGARETAEDLVQETFCEAWRSLADLRDKRDVRAWLFQILRYRYAHFDRNNRRKKPACTGLSDTIRRVSRTESSAACLRSVLKPIERGII